MAGTIIDHLTTIFDFKTDTSGINKADKAMDGFRHVTEKANETLEFFKRGIETIGVALGLEKINEWANEWDTAQNKLRSTGLEGKALQDTLDELTKISKENGVGVEGLSELYQQLNGSIGETASHAQLITTIDTLNKMMTINGTSASDAKNTMMDLSKALEGTTVRYQEIKFALQNIPALQQLIGKHFKEMGTTWQEALQGNQFSTEEFIKILAGLNDEVTATFNKMSQTIPQAIGNVINSIGYLFSVFRQESGATNFFVDSLNSVSNAIDSFRKFLKTHANTIEAIKISIIAALTQIALRMAVIVAPFLVITAAIVALVLVLDDLITFIKGGDSVIGRMVKSIKEWYSGFQETHPAIKSVVDTISSLISWVSELITWFFKSGEASNVFNYVIEVISAYLRLLIGVIELILNVIANLFEALANVGKALGSFAFDAVQAVTLAWNKFKEFRDWLLNVFATIGSFLLTPFKYMYEAIISPFTKAMNFIKGSSIGKWIAGKLGIDLSDGEGKTPTNKNGMVLQPNVPTSRVSLAEQQDRLMNLSNPNIPSSITNHSASSSSNFSDNSHTTINVSIPEGTTKEMATKIVTDAVNSLKQSYRIGAMNNDSRIAR